MLNTNLPSFDTMISSPLLMDEARVNGFLLTVTMPCSSCITLLAANAYSGIMAASGNAAAEIKNCRLEKLATLAFQ